MAPMMKKNETNTDDAGQVPKIARDLLGTRQSESDEVFKEPHESNILDASWTSGTSPSLYNEQPFLSARESLAVNGTEAPSHNGPASIKDSSALSNSVLSASKESSGDPQNAGKATAMDVGRHPDDSALARRSTGLIESRLLELERRLDAHTRRIDDHFDRLDGHLLRMHMQMTMMQHSFMPEGAPTLRKVLIRKLEKDTQAMLQQVFDEVVTLRAEIAELRDDI